MNYLFKPIANLTKLVLLFLFLLSIPVLSHAKDVSFVWTAVPDPLTGYKLYCQVEANAANAPIVLGKVTAHTLTGLASDKIYHFWLTAYNAAGESGNSAIITVNPESSSTPTIINISMQN